MKTKYRQARMAATVGIASNVFLSVIKLWAGLLSNSFALVADAFHSLSDVITSVFVLLGLKIAEQPSDANHPYGHTKAEALASSNVALLLIVSSVWMIYQSFQRYGVEVELKGGLALPVAGFSILLKEALFQWKSRVGRRVGSNAILADAWHHRTDALSSVCVFVGVGVVYWLGPDYSYVDSIAAVLVGLTVLVAGVQLYKECLSDLMDERVSGPFAEEVRTRAKRVEGVCDIEQLRIRKAGMEYLVDIHVEVESSLSVEDAHIIASRVRDDLVDNFTTVREVLVHIEPHTLGHNTHGPHTHEE